MPANKPESSAPRHAKHRERRRAAGFTEIILWAHVDDVEAVRAYAAKKLKAADTEGVFVWRRKGSLV
jgi:hypothetical protein